MPRDKRISIVGGIYHVIVRGIEQKEIFTDEKECNEFLSRLQTNLQKTKSRCYAWALMPNHFHLMVQTTTGSLSDLMRKLLTGYAVYFNKKHNRHGYLYQNRYKSILCQEDAYFQELVRYIHLNPLRANMVSGLDQLDNYLWSGHCAIMGEKKYDWQSVDDVLAWFGKNKKTAVKKYREFIADGISKKSAVDFSGGGLVRSVGGWSELLNLKRKKNYWRGDQRILGDSSFVDKALKQAEEVMSRKDVLLKQGWNLEKISAKVCESFGLKLQDLQRKGRSNNVSQAKGLVCYFGSKELGLSAAEIGRFLNISRFAVSKNIMIGEEIAIQKNVKLLS